ncbi:glycosyltransferase family 4 protein [Desulfothermus naphthae]
MNILMITINDPAGTAINFTKAINKYTSHTCRLITKEIRYNFMFEKDIHIPWIKTKEQWDEVESLLKNSDVIHFHMTADEEIELGPFKVKHYIKGKMIVHHHHGHPDFRSNPQKYREKYKKKKRTKLLVSTPDLLKLLPEAKWQPNLVPLNGPLYMPVDKPPFPVRICHSPTRRELKDTDFFIYVVNKLKQKIKGIKEIIIENTLHKECLKQKQYSHILFDHLQGYFGVSSLEGLSQGLCVVAGIDEWCRMHIHKFTQSDYLPWYVSSKDKLMEDILLLVNDRDLREEYGKRARSFMEKFWNEQKVIANLIAFYENEKQIN